MVRFLSRTVIGLVAVVLCCLSSSGASEVPKPEELLARYEAYVEELRTIGFDTLRMVYEKGGLFPDWTWDWITQASFARAGDQWRLRYHTVGFQFYDRVGPVNAIREDVFDGKSYFMTIRDDRGARELTSMDLDKAKKLLESEGIGPWRMDVSAEVDAEKPTATHRYFVSGEVSDLYGYINVDGVTVDDMLRQKATRLSSRRESIEGRSCDVLMGVTAHGTLTLWLDPASKYAPVRLRLWKEGDDLMDKTPMRLQKAEVGRWARPNLPMRQYELQEDFRLQSIKGRIAPASYVRIDRRIYQGGQEFVSRKESSLDHIRFDPKHDDLEPTLPIPEDTNVLLRNAPGIRAKWSGGKLVMNYDKPAVASLKGKWVSEVKTVSFWRRPLVVMIAVLLSLFGITLAWRHRSAVTASGRIGNRS